MDDLLTKIMRTTGASQEDATKVRDMVAEETMRRYLASQPETPPTVPESSTPAPIVVNVYVDDRLRERIVADVARGLNDATSQLKRSLEV